MIRADSIKMFTQKNVVFAQGDEVLLLLQNRVNKLVDKVEGPFRVFRKVLDVN